MSLKLFLRFKKLRQIPIYQKIFNFFDDKKQQNLFTYNLTVPNETYTREKLQFLFKATDEIKIRLLCLRVHANIMHTLERKQTNRTWQIRITEHTFQDGWIFQQQLEENHETGQKRDHVKTCEDSCNKACRNVSY